MKRIIITFTVLSLLIIVSSCYSSRTLTGQEKFSKYSDNKRIKILSVKTIHGNMVSFNSTHPGRISEKGITGLPKKIIKNGEQDSVIISEGKIKYIFDSGVCYEVIVQNKQGYRCHTLDTIQIPFSDIEQIRIRKFSTVKTICLVVGIILPTIII